MSGIRMKNKSWHSLQLAAVTSWLLLLDFHFLNVYFFSEAETAIQPGIKYVCRPLGNMHTVATISKSLLLTHNLHVERFPIWALQSELWTSIIINNNNLIIIFSTGMNLTIRCIPSTFYYTCVVFLKFYNCKFLVDLKKKKKGSYYFNHVSGQLLSLMTVYSSMNIDWNHAWCGSGVSIFPFMISDEPPRDLQYINMLSKKRPLGTRHANSSPLMLATVKALISDWWVRSVQ